MTHVSILVQEGISSDDNAVYFTDGPVKYEAVNAPVLGTEDRVRIVFVSFTPKNGPSRGKLMRVPFERIINVSEEV